MSKIKQIFENIHLKRYNNISLATLGKLMAQSISQDVFFVRIGAVSWALFLSIFPLTIFILSVLPYVPLYSELKRLLFTELIPHLLPTSISGQVIEFINDSMASKNAKGGISWTMILLTILLSSNGVYQIIKGFNDNFRTMYTKRRGFKMRLVSIRLTIILVLFLIVYLAFIYYTNFISRYVEESNTLYRFSFFFYFINYFSSILFYFVAILLLYRFGIKKTRKRKIQLPGAVFTTILFSLTAVGFNYYLTNFGNFDFLYGSLGLVMVMMIFIYINVLLFFLGFELNVSLEYSRSKRYSAFLEEQKEKESMK